MSTVTLRYTGAEAQVVANAGLVTLVVFVDVAGSLVTLRMVMDRSQARGLAAELELAADTPRGHGERRTGGGA